MTVINPETLEIEIKEVFSFECNAQSVFDDIYERVEYAVNNDEIEHEETLVNAKKFLDYSLTKEDKLAILNNIIEDYEYEQYGNREDYAVSIFDEDFANKAINDWIEETFEFRADEI